MKVLVTGGLGFIGSHTVVELLDRNFEVVVVDNLFNSTVEVVDKIKNITQREFDFIKVDSTDFVQMDSVFANNKFDAVIHFAGYKAVGESVKEPLMYYENNLMSTIVVSKLCLKHNVEKFIFSSSATVYGDNIAPFKEGMTLLPTSNPYGETKAMCERILKDTATVNDGFKVTLLRYFNPIGAHKSGLIGEKPNGIPNNLMPYVVQVANGKREKLSVFGNDYDTPDGTGVRDYIHVVDLAVGHVLALENMKDSVNVYNLGTGKGASVLEVINTFSKVNNVEIPYEIVERRAGDLPSSYADCEKAEKELGFKSKHTLEDMCRDAYNFKG